ncbi:hypothetical protein ACN28S_34670 [Cystobacter fuscus]
MKLTVYWLLSRRWAVLPAGSPCSGPEAGAQLALTASRLHVASLMTRDRRG